MLLIIMSHTNHVPRASFPADVEQRKGEGFGNVTGLKFESRARSQTRNVVRSEGR